MSINFDLADLKTFLAVKESGSFHRAAEILAVSQSAVTRRIQKLEQALGAALFERSTRQVRPTLAAKRLQARAEAILDVAEETMRAMRDETVAFAHQRGRVITLAIVPTVVADLLPPAIAAFRAEGGRARLRIIDVAANDVADAVADGEADFGVCSLPALDAGARFELLYEDALVLAAPQGHRLTSGPAPGWADLAEETVILPAQRTGNRLLIDEAAARARASLVWTIETQRSATALELVLGGAGVALLPLSALRALGGDRIAWRPLAGPPLSRPIGLLTRAGSPETPHVTALMNALRAAAQASQLAPNNNA